MPPGESTPEKSAPEPLRHVQRFVNSIDVETGEDELESPAALGRWLAERDLLAPKARVSAADLRRAVDVREGLRALMLQNNGLELDAGKVERLDAAAARAGVRVRFRAGEEPRLEPGSGGVDGALARLLAIAAAAVENGTWRRLKACPRERCEWAFYDHSKNRSARWCRMEECGNLEKARAFRERRRARTS
ncbi:MAG TPA: CGNR zinc finger domain-containing protein [Thermoleophilaceae bacterium]|nr:CGNR zinc finger domain-containing protein [Thermoleophilaceae bacterium]